MTRASLNLTLVLASLFAGACGKPGVLGEAPTVTGKIEEWTAGAGYRVAAVPFGFSGDTRLGSGAIDASGHLTLTLPSSADVAPHLSTPPGIGTGCAMQASVDPADLKVTSIGLFAQKDDGGRMLLLQANNPLGSPPKVGDLQADFMYADRAGRLFGTLECIGAITTTTTHYNIDFAKGWNTLLWKLEDYSRTPSSLKIVQSGRIDDPPSEVKWYAQVLPN